MTRRVSTGDLPESQVVRAKVAQAHAAVFGADEGRVSTVYPALAAADPALFGLAVVAADGGGTTTAGDADVPFVTMSVAKPFVLALMLATHGLDRVRALVGLNATGLPFNSVEAVERDPAGRTNPMVNAGAIATVSLAPGADDDERWAFVRDGLAAFAGRDLSLDEETVASVRATNHRNRALASLLRSVDALEGDPACAVDLYSRACCLSVTAEDLAVMGATLADGGTNPRTGQRVVDPEVARIVLAVMAVSGMYETSGDWLVDVGMPAKSGISGGLVTVSPGKGAIGCYSPPLDAAGNSVRGQLAVRWLTRELGLDLLASVPLHDR